MHGQQLKPPQSLREAVAYLTASPEVRIFGDGPLRKGCYYRDAQFLAFDAGMLRFLSHVPDQAATTLIEAFLVRPFNGSDREVGIAFDADGFRWLCGPTVHKIQYMND